MKRLWIAITFICIAVALAAGGYLHTRRLCGDAVERFSAIAQAAEKEDREKVEALCRDNEELWDRQSVLFGIYLNHAATDELQIYVRGLTRLAREGKFGELADDCYECIYYLKLIEEAVKPVVKNIL